MSNVFMGRARSPNGPPMKSEHRDNRGNGGFSDPALPVRKKLPHEIPPWIENDTLFFITVCAECRGAAPLCQIDIPTRLWDSIRHRADMHQWWPHLFLVMPDHVHALMSFATVPGMQRTMSSWKRFTARTIGIAWQRDFFDHRLRRDESFIEKCHYIRMNPVRDGLASRPEDWPHIWTMVGALGKSALPRQDKEQAHGRDGSPSRPQINPFRPE